MAKKKNYLFTKYPSHRFDRGGNTAGSDALTALGVTLGAGFADPSLANLQNDGTEQWAAIDQNNAEVIDPNNWDDFNSLVNNRKKLRTNYNSQDFMMSDGQLATSILGAGANGAMLGATSGGTLASRAITGAVGAAAGLLGSGMLASAQRVKANNLAQQLNEQAQDANAFMDRKIQNAALNMNYNTRNNALANLAAFGGTINNAYSNGVRVIDEGGTHEANPIGGVPQGIAQDGIPNLVEEDEVVYDDYVFSNRLNIPKAVKEEMKLKGNISTFADAAKKIQKESEERPNDMISNNGLKALMGRLQQAQEELKQKREMQKAMKAQKQEAELRNAIEQQMYGKGGFLAHKFGYADGDIAAITVPELKFKPLVNPIKYSDSKYIPKTTNLDLTLNTPTLLGAPATGNAGKEVTDPIDEKRGEWLRYAPIVGSAISALTSAFDRPDYSHLNVAQNRLNRVREISPKYITQKMAYNPMDINNAINQQTNLNLGNRRVMLEGSGNNAAAMINAMASNAYQNQAAMAATRKAGQEYNNTLLHQVLDFNRNTDSVNATAYNTAQKENMARDLNIAERQAVLANLMNAERDATQAGRSSVFTNLFENIGKAGVATLNYNQALNTAKYTAKSAANVEKYGGNLRTRKKGGKHA